MTLAAAIAALLLQQDPAGASAPSAPRGRVTIDAYDRRIEGWRSEEDIAYEATVRGGAAVAQGRQGALDGGWTVSSTDGRALLALQLVDGGYAYGLEGAWRDLAESGGARRSGFIALIVREGARTVLRFVEPGASAPTVVTVEPGLDGSWRGQITRDGVHSPVVMRRR